MGSAIAQQFKQMKNTVANRAKENQREFGYPNIRRGVGSVAGIL